MAPCAWGRRRSFLPPPEMDFPQDRHVVLLEDTAYLPSKSFLAMTERRLPRFQWVSGIRTPTITFNYPLSTLNRPLFYSEKE